MSHTASSAPRRPGVAVFCGSSPGREPVHAVLAERLGRAIAKRGLRLVYGGGSRGLMGTVAGAAADAGGSVLGVIPDCLRDIEGAFTRADIARVACMHERKARMAEAADGFVVLPGGVGTLEEAVEILSWARLGLHDKPMVFLDADGFWDGFFAFMRHSVDAGFTPPAVMDQLARAHDADAALDAVAASAQAAA